LLDKVLGFFRTGPDKALLSDDPEQIRRVYERKRWGVFLSVTFGYGFFYVARINFSVVKKPLLDEGIFSATEMGIIGAAMLGVYAVGKTLNGFLADRANIRRFMATALLLSALTNLILGSTTLFLAFVVLWGINGWFQSVGSAPCGASLRQWFSSREYGTRYGIWSSSHGIGTALTFLVTAAIVDTFGWRWGFWAPGIAVGLVALILYKTLADRPRTYGLPTVADYKDDHPVETEHPEALSKSSVKAMQMSVFKNPAIWVIGLSSAMMYVSRYGINNWGVLYLQEAKGYSLVEAGATLGVYTIATVVGAVASGFVSDHFFNSRRNVPALLMGLLMLGSLGMLYLTPAGQRSLDLVALTIFGFALGMQLAYVGGLWAVDISPPRAAGTAMGLIGGFSYVGAAIQDAISGALIDQGKSVTDGVTRYDFSSVFAFWLGTALISLLLVFVVWNAKPRV
jgi:MFS transporter, OPA family, sugar phosphate sensor protein UhpC